MDSIHIQGGVALRGKVRIQGSKNAALPILAATLLTKETSHLQNCPRIADVYCMIRLLRSLGVCVRWEENGVRVNAKSLQTDELVLGNMPTEAVRSMRSSLCLLGALLGRVGAVTMEYPGGCVIGERPIDIHIAALKQMGVVFAEADGMLTASAQTLHGADITLPFPSVGATENVILTAVMAEGTTILRGAAREPEVVALCEYLEQCGARIEGAGGQTIQIEGTGQLYGTHYQIPPDRIVAGTYLFGAVGAGGSVLLERAPIQQMEAVLELAKQMGAQCDLTTEGLYVQMETRPQAVPLLCTAPYPGFPTDLQSPALTVLTCAEGDSVIEENIFENRFRVVEPLRSLGAQIELLDRHRVAVHGVERLHGTVMEAKELRGGAALLLAGLVADGESIITGCSYIYRGYENICKDLRELGARITSV
ncbi:MAG: UDP-N-acetylglucosamine 1-carboxyvinyltransferase [Lachnospiraceae bacterium]|nr:UDP-N-acetylglucosamine 1-carboxyvinyltransferase [Lachnospiraceae bacterium]